MIQVFFDIIRGVSRAFGVELLRHNPANSELALIKFLLQEHQILQVLDVGANQGQFAEKLRNKINYRGQIISFEPVSASFEKLSHMSQKDDQWSVVQMAVGDRQGEMPIHISLNSVSSSLKQATQSAVEAEKGIKVVGTEDVFIDTLDHLTIKYKIQSGYWLKIDVQGFEREVLTGAKQVLKEAKVVQIELALTPSYQNGSYIEEIISTLRNEGFVVYSLLAGYSNYTTGKMYEAEGFFVRE